MTNEHDSEVLALCEAHGLTHLQKLWKNRKEVLSQKVEWYMLSGDVGVVEYNYTEIFRGRVLADVLTAVNLAIQYGRRALITRVDGKIISQPIPFMGGFEEYPGASEDSMRLRVLRDLKYYADADDWVIECSLETGRLHENFFEDKRKTFERDIEAARVLLAATPTNA